jgi:hypothetical protein
MISKLSKAIDETFSTYASAPWLLKANSLPLMRGKAQGNHASELATTNEPRPLRFTAAIVRLLLR